MKKKATKYHQLNSFSLMNEGLYLLRGGGVDTVLYYYLGSLPFMLGLLFFWHDMASGAFALQRMATESLFLALAFGWMKLWQTIFCRRLYELRIGLPPTPLTLRRIGNIFISQMSVQPWGLIVVPLSLLLVLPFAVVHTFFQNYSVLDQGERHEGMIKQALAQARLWPIQNHLIIWLLSPWLLAVIFIVCFGSTAMLLNTVAGDISWYFAGQGDLPWVFLGAMLIVLGVWPSSPLGMAIAVNIVLMLWTIPQLLNSLFGVETVFVRGGWYAIGNSTVLLTIYVLTHLILDPVLKSAYVLRCFYGKAVKDGADLLADLKKTALGAVVLVTLIGLYALPVQAQTSDSALPSKETIQELNMGIESALQQEEYAWRLGRPKQQSSDISLFSGLDFSFLKPVSEALTNTTKWIYDLLSDFFTWIDKLFSKNSPPTESEKSSADIREMMKPVIYILAILSLIFGLRQLYRLWRLRRERPEIQQTSVEMVIPDLADEKVTADQLPEDKWLELAEQMLAENKLHLALRALYLAGLACLGNLRIVRLEPYKSNREYGREVNRYGVNYPEIPILFQQNVLLFEKVWYGNYPTKQEYLEDLKKNQESIRGYFANARP